MKIVVIGGTGRIGSKVVARLRDQGHEVVAAARHTGVDVLTGAGVEAAMVGALFSVGPYRRPLRCEEAWAG